MNLIRRIFEFEFSTRIEDLKLVIPVETFPLWASFLSDGVAPRLRHLSVTILDRDGEQFKTELWDEPSDLTIATMLRQRETFGGVPRLEHLSVAVGSLTTEEETQIRDLVGQLEFI